MKCDLCGKEGHQYKEGYYVYRDTPSMNPMWIKWCKSLPVSRSYWLRVKKFQGE